MYIPTDLATSTPWLVFGLIISAISLVLMFFPRVDSCIVGYMGLWAAKLSGYTPFTGGTMIFWGAAVVIVLINRYLLPAHIRTSGRGLGYIAGGAIAGMMVGLTMYRAATVIGGAVVGALLGAIAYSRTERGGVLGFPSAKFFNYLGAKGIPAVITASMAGLVIAGLIARSMITAQL